MAFLNERGLQKLWSHILLKIQASKTPIDNTLTQTEQAADAKAVGDKITELSTAITQDKIDEICGSTVYSGTEVEL